MALHKDWSVYGLLDPDSRKLMYVGMTGNSVYRRYHQHLYNGKFARDCGTRCARWIRSLLDDGKRPLSTVFAVASEESIARRVEADLARLYCPPMNGNLTGQGGGGSGGPGHNQPRAVCSLTTGEVWPSQMAAAKALGVSTRAVRFVLEGRGKTVAGHRIAHLDANASARKAA